MEKCKYKASEATQFVCQRVKIELLAAFGRPIIIKKKRPKLESKRAR